MVDRLNTYFVCENQSIVHWFTHVSDINLFPSLFLHAEMYDLFLSFYQLWGGDNLKPGETPLMKEIVCLLRFFFELAPNLLV